MLCFRTDSCPKPILSDYFQLVFTISSFSKSLLLNILGLYIYEIVYPSLYTEQRRIELQAQPTWKADENEAPYSRAEILSLYYMSYCCRK